MRLFLPYMRSVRTIAHIHKINKKINNWLTPDGEFTVSHNGSFSLSAALAERARRKAEEAEKKTRGKVVYYGRGGWRRRRRRRGRGRGGGGGLGRGKRNFFRYQSELLEYDLNGGRRPEGKSQQKRVVKREEAEARRKESERVCGIDKGGKKNKKERKQRK